MLFFGKFTYIINIRHIKKLLLAVMVMTFSVQGMRGQISTEQAITIGKNVWYFEDYVLSIWYFNTAIQAKPYLAEPYLYRAIAKINLEDYLGAEADATSAIDRNPFITDAWEVRGVARQNIGKNKEAIEDYDHALSLLPKNKQILFNKAIAQTSVEDYENADSTFRKIIALYPKFENARLGLARNMLANKDTTNAMKEIDEALRLNAKSFNAYAMKADILANRGKESFPDAISAIDSALRLHPRAAGLYINRAYMKYQLDDYFGAMSDYDHAITLEPYNKTALFNRGLLNSEVNANDRALEDFDRVINLDPNDLRARYCRSFIYANKHQYDDAIADISYVIRAYPDFPTGYFIRSDFYRQAGKLSSAQKDQSTAQRLNRQLRPDANGRVEDPYENVKLSDDETARREFASLLTVRDNTDMREEYNNSDIRGKIQDRNVEINIEPFVELTYYSSPTELNPDTYFIKEITDLNSARVLRNIIVVTTHVPAIIDNDLIEKHSRSIEDYNSYLSSHTPRPVDYIGRAMDFISLRNYKSAIADLDRAIELNPDYAPSYMLRAQARYNQGVNSPSDMGDNPVPADHVTRVSLERANADMILSDLDKAISLTDNNPFLYYNKGNILVGLSDMFNAEESYTKAIELKSNFAEAYFNRGYTRLKLGKRQEGMADLSKAGELGVVAAYNLLKRMGNMQ